MTFFTVNDFQKKNVEKLQKINENVYFYKDFLNYDLKTNYEEILQIVEEEVWENEHWNVEPGDRKGTFWHSRTSPAIWKYDRFWSKLYNFFAPDFLPLGMYRVFNRLKTGENCPVEICCPSDFEKYFNFLGWEWKVAIYIGEFTGGEVVFPDLDLSIKPESGDLLIWKYNLNHYVNTVKSGTRYVYTDLLVSPINVFFA